MNGTKTSGLFFGGDSRLTSHRMSGLRSIRGARSACKSSVPTSQCYRPNSRSAAGQDIIPIGHQSKHPHIDDTQKFARTPFEVRAKSREETPRIAGITRYARRDRDMAGKIGSSAFSASRVNRSNYTVGKPLQIINCSLSLLSNLHCVNLSLQFHLRFRNRLDYSFNILSLFRAIAYMVRKGYFD